MYNASYLHTDPQNIARCLSCIPFTLCSISKWLSHSYLSEVLDQILEENEEDTEVKPEIEEDVFEVEDNTDLDPDFEETDQQTDGEGQEPEETFQSKSRDLRWSSSPQDREGGQKWKTL